MSRVASAEKRSQWRDRLQRFGRSQLSAAEFCRREQVSAASFYQWRRRLADESARRRPTRASFVPVQVAPVQVAASIGVEVAFPNGARLTLPAHDHALIKTSIQAIARARTTEKRDARIA
jgi:transposase